MAGMTAVTATAFMPCVILVFAMLHVSLMLLVLPVSRLFIVSRVHRVIVAILVGHMP